MLPVFFEKNSVSAGQKQQHHEKRPEVVEQTCKKERAWRLAAA
jgi:hypothetical protein